MPVYPQIKTYRGGFYNNKVVDGTNDRTYSAKDIRKPYDVIYSDGIKPTADGDAGDVLKVTAGNGLTINVAKGYAKLGGAWFENTAPYSIILDNPTSTTRYDCVIIRNDDNDSVREPSIYIKSLNHIPTVNDLTRNEYIYEICIAYITVSSGTVSITNNNITDTRMDGSLCNVMSGVGATVVRTYRNTYYSQSLNQTVIPIGIPQYNKAKDTLTVAVEGRIFSEGVNYTITSNSNITLNIGLPVINTKIDFEVLKNVNAASSESVVAEVGALTNWRNNVVDKMLEHHYYCNGVNDNIQISNLVRTLNNTTFSKYNNYRICVHGVFGATTYISGSGTAANAYAWFVFGSSDTPTSRVVVDFSDCSEITIPLINNSYNTVFLGTWVEIYGASVKAENQNSIVRINTSTNGYFKAEKCRFFVKGSSDSFISYLGDFVNCYGRVINNDGLSWCFPVRKYLRLQGGEYLAYHNGSNTSGIASINADYSSAAVFAYGVNAPNVSISNYDQTYTWYSKYANKLTAIGTITNNPSYIENTVINSDANNTRNIIGTIPLNISNII